MHLNLPPGCMRIGISWCEYFKLQAWDFWELQISEWALFFRKMSILCLKKIPNFRVSVTWSLCAMHQQHRSQCFAISHSKCQSSAVSDRPLPELMLIHTIWHHAPYSIVNWTKIRAIGGHKSRGMNFGVSHCRSSIVWRTWWAKPKATN